jgi:S1-C subfamily serine protease
MFAILMALLLTVNGFSVSEADSPPRYNAEELYSHAEEAIFYVRVLREDGTLKDVGTGFVIRPDGTALTAYHVVVETEQVECVLNDLSTVTGRVIARNEAADTAVLKLEQPADNAGIQRTYPFIPLRTGQVKHGERVFAIGFPMKGTKIITEGIVNAARASINGRDRVLVSAELVNGMSGGPLLDEHGYAAGILSGSLRTMSGIHLAVSAEEAAAVAK